HQKKAKIKILFIVHNKVTHSFHQVRRYIDRNSQKNSANKQWFSLPQ
ncbi:MAG: hypothetical protein ACI90V_002480, partial [Bacillariaceae sp.]